MTKLLNVKQVAELLTIGTSVVYELAAAGEISHVRCGFSIEASGDLPPSDFKCPAFAAQLKTRWTLVIAPRLPVFQPGCESTHR